MPPPHWEWSPATPCRSKVREVTVVGTWRLADANDARWMADEQWTTGADGSTVGPIIIDPSLWSTLDAEPWVTWAIMPDVDRLQPTDLAAIDHAWDGGIRCPQGRGSGHRRPIRPVPRRGGELGARLAALRTALPLALVILAAIAALTLWELAGLTTRTRATETALLWSRGATTASLAVRAGAEAGVVTAIGSAVGVAVAALLQWNAGGTDAAASVLASGWWAAAAVIAVSGPGLRDSRSAHRRPGALCRPRGARAGVRRRGRCRAAPHRCRTLHLAAPHVRAGQRDGHQRHERGPGHGRRAGAHPRERGAARPLRVPAARRAAERTATRTTGMALAVRGVSRRIGAAAATIVMIGLAVGQLIVAAGYSADLDAGFTQTQELRAGTVLRLTAGSAGIAQTDLDRAGAATAVPGSHPCTRCRSASAATGRACWASRRRRSPT